LYSDADIRRLGLLRQLTQAGQNIGNIANRSDSELLEILASSQVPPNGIQLEEPAREASLSEKSGKLIADAMLAIENLDSHKLDQILTKGHLLLGHNGLLHHLIVPLTQRVGDAWEDGGLKIAHEHFASAILRTFLGNAARPLALPENAPLLVVATPAGQLHELGAVLVSAGAANLGWRVTYLGASLPAAEIAGAALQGNARAVALSIVYPADDPHMATELKTLKNYLPQATAILAGGRAADAYKKTLDKIDATLCHDLKALYSQLNRLRRES
jgi:methanogenic corrinoid protein MtbC1